MYILLIQPELINFLPVSTEKVENFIRSLNVEKNTGCNYIPSYVYKGCCEILAALIVRFFQTAIQSRIFPSSKDLNCDSCLKSEVTADKRKLYTFYIDCAKVFDKVGQKVLLGKLCRLGLS